MSMEEFSRMVLGEISSEDSEIFSFNSDTVFPPIFLNGKESSVSEKKLEISGKTDFRQSSANSEPEIPEGLIPCEFCAEQGKPMFFATLEDLQGHVKAFHGGYPNSKPDYVR